MEEELSHVKRKMNHRVVMAETPIHLSDRTKVHHSRQLSWPRVPANIWGIFAIAEVGVAPNIGND